MKIMMSHPGRAIVCSLLMGAFSVALGEEAAKPFTPSTVGKKLIEYGWDCPTTSYLREHITEMEKRPFDGIIIKVTRTRDPQKTATRDTLGWNVFYNRTFKPEEYEHAIEDIKATKFQKFTDNFIQVISMPGLDWFDPNWGSVASNVAILARIAKAGGCVGLMFDPEQYGAQKLWTYAMLPEARRNEISKEQYVAKARERGGEFMRAINAEFPGIRIICLFGPSLALSGKYDLLPPFMEGMCLAADKGTEITDGFEQSYGFSARNAFADGRNAMAVKARDLFGSKNDFDRVMRVGFGLWMDNQSQIPSRKGWFPDEPEKNYFQPSKWQSAVHNALSFSDRYVWIYSERLNWWTGSVGDAYEQALVAGRNGPGSVPSEPNPARAATAIKAASIAESKDATTFGPLDSTHETLFDFPSTGWRFRVDPNDVGTKESWFSKSQDTTHWPAIEIRKFWDEQGWDCVGYGWYRLNFVAPEIPAGRKIELVVGAADEAATVWLNGEKVGEFDQGTSGWNKRFSIDVTGKLVSGQENQIAIRVMNNEGIGGLWKSIRLMAGRVTN